MSDNERRLINHQNDVAYEYEQVIKNLNVPKLVIDTDNKSPEKEFNDMLFNMKEYDLNLYKQFTKKMRIHHYDCNS